jgi:hypothetical protein
MKEFAMKHRSIASIGSAILFSHIVNVQGSLIFSERQDDTDIKCTFEGNSDFYGIGVRLGFYFTWFSGLLSFVINPEDADSQADAQTIFLFANLIALVILQGQEHVKSPNASPPAPVVVPILLFYMFFGGSVSAVTSATTGLIGWRKANRKERIILAGRQVFVQLIFLSTLAYSIFFWTEGFKVFPKPPCGSVFVFPVFNRITFDDPTTGSYLAISMLVVFYLLIWLVSWRRLRGSFPSHLPLRTVLSTRHSFDRQEVQALPPWDRKVL